MFIGEAPGKEEVIEGIPFVGRSGQELSKILFDYGFNEGRIRFNNVCMCQPPKNRDPKQPEIDAAGHVFYRTFSYVNQR